MPLVAPYDRNDENTVKHVHQLLDRLLRVDRNSRRPFLSEWFQNMLYYVGIQWIIKEQGLFRRRRLPRWYPRLVTNKFAEKANDLIANILAVGKPPIWYSPATDDEEDFATAEIEERFREVIYEEAEFDEWDNVLATCVVLTGNAFLLPYYDYDKQYGTRTLPMRQCLACQAQVSPAAIEDNAGLCPECDFGSDFSSTDESGAPLTHEVPIGRFQTDVVSGFEIRCDHTIPLMHKHRWFVRQRFYDLDYAKERWKEYAEFMHPVEQGGEEARDLYYLQAMANVTTSFLETRITGTSGTAGGSGTTTDNPKILAYELNVLPTEDFPNGLRAVRIGSDERAIVELGELPDEVGAGPSKGRKFLAIVHMGGDIVYGRFWRKTRLSDLIQKQAFRNIIESSIKLGVQRAANAGWLNPIGAGVSAAELTGEHGLIVNYNPVFGTGATFAKPERFPADLGWVQPLIMLLNKTDDDMERVAGTFFLGGGDTPPGVTAASALAYLGEKSQKAMSPWLRAWARGFKRWEGMGLEIMRAHATDERVYMTVGRNKRWEAQKFSQANLAGAVNTRIDYEGLFPKSQATTRATIAQLIQLQVLNPQDPEQQRKILEAFGETALRGSVDLDEREAAKEWDRFFNNDEKPVIIPLVQNSIVHLSMHGDAAKSEEFRDLMKTNPAKAQAWIDHIQLTAQDIVMRRTAFGQLGGEPGQEDMGATPPRSSGSQVNVPTPGETPDIAAPREAKPPPGAE